MKKRVQFVNVDLCNLCKDPNFAFPHDYSHQSNRLSQLTFGEEVVVHKQEKEWLYISALEQFRVLHKQWQPYLGWVQKKELSFEIVQKPKPSFFQKIDRSLLMQGSSLFLDQPYLWGGCSPPIPGKIASVDCSGLVYQLFKRQNKLIPRDAHDQFLAAKPIKKVEPGDLLFLKPLTRPKRVSHVMIVYNQEYLLEAPESGKKVRLLQWNKEIVQKNGLFHIFDRSQPYFGSFGSLIACP